MGGWRERVGGREGERWGREEKEREREWSGGERRGEKGKGEEREEGRGKREGKIKEKEKDRKRFWHSAFICV